jgi:hypothetical protein
MSHVNFLCVAATVIIGVGVVNASAGDLRRHHAHRTHHSSGAPAFAVSNSPDVLDLGACAGSPNLDHFKPPYTWHQRYDYICNRQNAGAGR